MKKPEFKILSIDGGGIRGIIPCTILKFIEEETRYRISDMFNLIAGTSTGGIISLGLTMPDEYGAPKFTAEDMLNIYVKNGGRIFPPKSISILGLLAPFGLADKPYDNKSLEGLFLEKFGDTRMKDALVPLLITSYEVQEGRPFYFTTREAMMKEDENKLFREAARSTSAAPTYFKPSKVKYQDEQMSFVDGGIFANNPSILAYGEAKELWKAKNKPVVTKAPDNSKGFDAVVTADNNDLPFYMLSLGTAYTACNIKRSEVDDWRTANWLNPMLTDVFARSVAESTHYTMQYLMPPYDDANEAKDRTPRYSRLNMEIAAENAEMDNITQANLDNLVSIGEQFVKDNKNELLKICEIIG
ncbi:MAG: hypothetical protein JWQ38_2535 [Flavipsychrobacter sp.]|nr:hypothetical protein [Flavipsychrobacter sp.]